MRQSLPRVFIFDSLQKNETNSLQNPSVNVYLNFCFKMPSASFLFLNHQPLTKIRKCFRYIIQTNEQTQMSLLILYRDDCCDYKSDLSFAKLSRNSKQESITWSQYRRIISTRIEIPAKMDFIIRWIRQTYKNLCYNRILQIVSANQIPFLIFHQISQIDKLTPSFTQYSIYSKILGKNYIALSSVASSKSNKPPPKMYKTIKAIILFISIVSHLQSQLIYLMSYRPTVTSTGTHQLTEFVPTYVPHSDYLPNKVVEGNQTANQWLSNYEQQKRLGQVYTQRPAEFNPNRYVSARTYENVLVQQPISEAEFNSRFRKL